MDNKGQSLVELAVTFLVLILLLSGAVDLSTALFQFIQLRDASQEGALYGSICQNDNSIEMRSRWASDTPLDLSSDDVQVSIEYLDADGNPSSYVVLGYGVRITMFYKHEIFMPFLSGQVIPLKAYTTNTILQVNQSC